MDNVLRQILFFIVLVLIQVLLFSNIDYMGYVSPYVYVLFILSLPLGFNKYASLGIAFLLGLVIDMFSNTPGVHISATVAMAYARDYWVGFVLPNNEMGPVEPSLGKLGLRNFLSYTIGLVLLHHLILFFAEAWSFSLAWFTVLKAVLNTVITTLLIVCYYLITKK